MVKTFKCAFAFVLVVAMLLTSMSMGVFATSAAKNDWLWTGDDSPAFRNGAKNSTSTQYLTTLNQISGNFGKVSDDKVYEVFDTGSSHDLSQWGDFTLSGGNTAYNDYAVEFSFAFSSLNDSVGFNTQVYVESTLVTSRTYTNFFAIHSDYVYLANQKHIKDVNGNDISFEAGKWYNVSLVVDAENDKSAEVPESSYTHKLYINGELFVSTTKTPGTYNKDDANTFRIYSDRTIRLGTDSVSAKTYFDNVTIRNIENAATFAPADAALSTLTSNNSAISVNGKNISVPTGTTVGTLKQALVSSGANDNIRFYNSDYTAELLDGDSAANINIVVASPRAYSETETRENTYAYYTTAKAYKTFDGINLDASSIGTEIASGSQTLVNVVDGGYGKYDKVYEFSSVSDGSISSTNGYHPEPFAIISEGSAKQRVLEFAFMLPEGSKGIRLIAHCWGCAHGGNKESSVGITPTGVKVLYTVPNVIPYEFDYNKWYNIALVFPGKTDSDSCGATLTAYVNGEKIGETPYDEVLGLRRLRVAAISTADEQRVFAYLDNIRNNDTSYANAAYDADDAIIASGYDTDAKADKFYITEETTVSAIKEAISDIKEDTTVYVLNANGAIMNDADNVSNGCTVAVAAMHDTASVRTVSYYDIENIAGKFVVKTPEYTVTDSNASVAFDTINKTGSAVTVTAIIAVYNPDGSLKTVTTVPCTTGAGLNGSFAEGISAAYSAATDEVPSDKVKFMIWTSTESDITPKVKSAVLVD